MPCKTGLADGAGATSWACVADGGALVLLLRIHRGGSDHGQCESQDYALCVNPCTSGH